jgi:hypothetical protein
MYIDVYRYGCLHVHVCVLFTVFLFFRHCSVCVLLGEGARGQSTCTGINYTRGWRRYILTMYPTYMCPLPPPPSIATTFHCHYLPPFTTIITAIHHPPPPVTVHNTNLCAHVYLPHVHTHTHTHIHIYIYIYIYILYMHIYVCIIYIYIYIYTNLSRCIRIRTRS